MAYRLETKKSWHETDRALTAEFQRWGQLRRGRVEWKLENVRGRRDVTLRYTLPGEPEVVLQMAKQASAEDNLRVLYLAIEAMRLNEVRGIADVIREAYLALPAPAREADPYEVLGVVRTMDLEDIKAVWQSKLRRGAHPDVGGNSADATALNKAWEAIRVDRSGS